MKRRRIAEVFLASDTDLLRVGVGLYTVIFGLWLVLPPPFAINPVFKTLDAMGPLWAWGAMTIGLGLVRIFGAVTDRLQTYWFYRLSSMLNFLLWTFFAGWAVFATTITATIPAVVPLNMLIALACGWLYLRGGWDQARMELRARSAQL